MATRHRHEQTMWLICGGSVAWCYQCGAWKYNFKTTEPNRWQKPTGLGGPNPAMKGVTNGIRKAG